MKKSLSGQKPNMGEKPILIESILAGKKSKVKENMSKWITSF
jgi:hypothetical protein